MGGHTAHSPQNGVVEGKIRRVCVCFAVGCDGVAAVVRRRGVAAVERSRRRVLSDKQK